MSWFVGKLALPDYDVLGQFYFLCAKLSRRTIGQCKGHHTRFALFFFLQTKFVKWSDMILSWWCVVSSLHLPQNTQTISRYRTARLLNALVCFIIFLFLMIVSCLRHFIDGMVLAMSVVTIAYSAKWSCWWNK